MTAPELPHAPEANAVGAPVEQPVRPYATSVTWRNDKGGSWQQWHDDDDPMPTEWDDRPPDEVVHVYTAEQLRAAVAAERERWKAPTLVLWPLTHRVTKDLVFTAERAGEVQAALETLRGLLKA